MAAQTWRRAIVRGVLSGALAGQALFALPALAESQAMKSQPYCPPTPGTDYFDQAPAPPGNLPSAQGSSSSDRAQGRSQDGTPDSNPPPLFPDSGTSPSTAFPGAAGADAFDPGAMGDVGDSLSSATGGAASPASGAPNMVGDLFGLGGQALIFTDIFALPPVAGAIPLPIAGGDRPFKIAENSNVLPQDRVFFNYHHFEDALLTGVSDNRHALSLDRYTFGIERAWLCGAFSTEIRIPFATGLSNDQNDTLGVRGTEYGNVVLNFKTLLRQTCTTALSAGVGVTIPTATDGVIDSGLEQVLIENNSVHVAPYLGATWQPWCGNAFANAFAQLDFDVNGNEIHSLGGVGGDQLAGVYQEQTLLYLDGAFGYWLHRNPCGFLTGVAPTVELHYTTSLQDSDEVGVNFGAIGNLLNRYDILNLTAGVHFDLCNASTLTVAYVEPLQTDEVSNPIINGIGVTYPDWEVAVQFNRRF